MNTIQVSNCKVMEYSNANPVGFVKSENQHGKYVCFRIYEKQYKQKPIPWFCIANGGLADKVEKMGLVPGDSVIVSGSVEQYLDKERNRESKRIIITNIDYNYDSMHKKEKENTENVTDADKQTAENIKSQTEDSTAIDLSQCDIFQQEIN